MSAWKLNSNKLRFWRFQLSLSTLLYLPHIYWCTHLPTHIEDLDKQLTYHGVSKPTWYRLNWILIVGNPCSPAQYEVAAETKQSALADILQLILPEYFSCDLTAGIGSWSHYQATLFLRKSIISHQPSIGEWWENRGNSSKKSIIFTAASENKTFCNGCCLLLKQGVANDARCSWKMTWIFEGLKLAPRMLIKRSAIFGCNFMVILSFSEPFCSFHGLVDMIRKRQWKWHKITWALELENEINASRLKTPLWVF